MIRGALFNDLFIFYVSNEIYFIVDITLIHIIKLLTLVL